MREIVGMDQLTTGAEMPRVFPVRAGHLYDLWIRWGLAGVAAT